MKTESDDNQISYDEPETKMRSGQKIRILLSTAAVIAAIILLVFLAYS